MADMMAGLEDEGTNCIATAPTPFSTAYGGIIDLEFEKVTREMVGEGADVFIKETYDLEVTAIRALDKAKSTQPNVNLSVFSIGAIMKSQLKGDTGKTKSKKPYDKSLVASVNANTKIQHGEDTGKTKLNELYDIFSAASNNANTQIQPGGNVGKTKSKQPYIKSFVSSVSASLESPLREDVDKNIQANTHHNAGVSGVAGIAADGSFYNSGDSHLFNGLSLLLPHSEKRVASSEMELELSHRSSPLSSPRSHSTYAGSDTKLAPTLHIEQRNRFGRASLGEISAAVKSVDRLVKKMVKASRSEIDEQQDKLVALIPMMRKVIAQLQPLDEYSQYGSDDELDVSGDKTPLDGVNDKMVSFQLIPDALGVAQPTVWIDKSSVRNRCELSRLFELSNVDPQEDEQRLKDFIRKLPKGISEDQQIAEIMSFKSDRKVLRGKADPTYDQACRLAIARILPKWLDSTVPMDQVTRLQWEIAAAIAPTWGMCYSFSGYIYPVMSTLKDIYATCFEKDGYDIERWTEPVKHVPVGCSRIHQSITDIFNPSYYNTTSLGSLLAKLASLRSQLAASGDAYYRDVGLSNQAKLVWLAQSLAHTNYLELRGKPVSSEKIDAIPSSFDAVGAGLIRPIHSVEIEFHIALINLRGKSAFVDALDPDMMRMVERSSLPDRDDVLSIMNIAINNHNPVEENAVNTSLFDTIGYM